MMAYASNAFLPNIVALGTEPASLSSPCQRTTNHATEAGHRSKTVTIRCCVCTVVLSTGELNRPRPLPRYYCMVAGSCRLRAKLRNPRSRGLEHIITPVTSTSLVSNGVFSLPGACPATISDWVYLPAPAKDWLIDFGDPVKTSFVRVHCASRQIYILVAIARDLQVVCRHTVLHWHISRISFSTSWRVKVTHYLNELVFCESVFSFSRYYVFACVMFSSRSFSENVTTGFHCMQNKTKNVLQY